MTLFFLVAGLEVRREFDMGEIRERRRLVLPFVAGLGGMIVPIGIFVAFNWGRGSIGGWAVPMSTDTAFALGVLALVGPRFPDRLRIFLLTVSVIDDVAGLVVIATVYSGGVRLAPLVVALALIAGIAVAAEAGVGRGSVYAVLGLAGWVALSRSGVDPIVIGLAIGLCTGAAAANRRQLERASGLFRQFREQPTTELAHSARMGLESAISPNDRLQRQYHAWTSYVIVPLFALANTGMGLTRFAGQVDYAA